MAETLEGGAAGSVSGGQLRRFVLEGRPVRAFWVRLDEAWCELRGLQRHAAAVDTLLGEAVTASVLLAATLKFHGRLTLQLQSTGPVRLLVAQCTHDFQIRAVAHANETTGMAAGFRDLVGDDGRLAVTIEADERTARYQGIVALEGQSLAACLESYFASSEQLPTRIALAAGTERATGVLLQRLPIPNTQGEAHAALSHGAWEDLQLKLAALGAPLLQSDAAEQALRRICGVHEGRLFAGTPVRFACGCSRARVAQLLDALGPQQVQEVLAEHGAVTVTCEFCGRPYRFDAIDVQGLFAGGAQPQAPGSVN
ncbi:MAG: Hsp33 family molecular chaperone HslO [Steroidobacteraceae bacterium]